MRQAAVGFFLVLLLCGCSAASNAASESDVEAVSTEPIVNTPAYYEGYAENPQVTNDRQLLEVNQSVRDEKGQLTLQQINTEAQQLNLGDVELQLYETKVMHYRPDYSLIDFFHTYTHDEEFTFVKVFAEVKNNSDQAIKFSPIALVHTSAGEQKNWEDDIYLEQWNETLEPGAAKKGNFGFIIENEKITSIELTTSDLFSANEEEIQEAESITISF